MPCGCKKKGYGAKKLKRVRSTRVVRKRVKKPVRKRK